jgi:hypothetical protein
VSTYRFTDLREAVQFIVKNEAARNARVMQAVRKAARETRNLIVSETVPRAHGELAESIHVVDVGPGHSEIVADAPHAAAVEVGSRPHTPPIAPLIAWVTLRGLQGLTPSGRVRPNRLTYGLVKNWKREPARIIASQLQARLGRAGAASWRAAAKAAGSLAEADPAVVSIARAIQMKIKHFGTKPHRFMAGGVPIAIAQLDRFVREALPDR